MVTQTTDQSVQKQGRGRPRKYHLHSENFPEYSVWKQMKQRCYNPKHTSFPYYGGKGVAVCQEWQTDFSAFYKHIGPRPSQEHSIDRIDGTLGYQPGNVRWATRVVQQNNKSNNKPLTFRNVTLNLAQWAQKMNMSSQLLAYRIKVGWSIEKALFTKPRKYLRKTGTHKTQQAA